MRGIRQAIRNYKGKPKRKRQKGPSIKFRVLTLITDGRDDQFIITSIKKEFPKSKFNKIHISWYRSTLHRDGIISPEFTAKKSRAYKEWAKSLEN
ncbi:hypothetical protein IID23_02220 [Patescibacteria group bacterium]|nr:hypothetical protein [Patescibacteria group bacterium]